MKTQYKFDPSHNLIILKYSGIFSVDHHFAFGKHLTTIPEWQTKSAVLTDLRDVKLDISRSLLETLAAFRLNVLGESYRSIFLVSQPRSTAFLQLYQQKLADKGVQYITCSSIQGAADLVGMTATELINNLEHLSTEYTFVESAK